MIKVIAEVANAHQGSPDTALRIAQEAVKAGADAVKFQIYFAEELLAASHPRYEHFKNQSFSVETWDRLLPEAKKLGVAIYADVFGEKALEVAKRHNVDGYKVHSSDLGNTKLLQRLADETKTLFLAVGGSSFPEISQALHILGAGKSGSDREIVLLHGFQSYPTAIQDTNLNRLKVLKESYGNVASFGYMDHASGDDSFAVLLPLIAVPYEIQYIEKHITLDRAAKGVDYYSSLNPDEFARFISELRRAESALGLRGETFSESEKKYRQDVKKRWVAAEPLPAGHILTPKDLEMKRVQAMGHCPDFERLINKKLLVPIGRDQPINNSLVAHQVLALVVARSRSSRLPKKALLDLGGRPAIAHLFERLKLALSQGFVDRVAFCTTREDADDELVKIASEYPFKIYRGDTDNVLSRMLIALNDNPECDIALRITGDDLLVDPVYLHKTVTCHLESNADYTDAKQLPSGTEVEVFNTDILRLLHVLGRNTEGTEYLTNYITDNRDQFKVASLDVPPDHQKKHRLTMDTQEDYELIKALLAHVKGEGREFDYSMDDIMSFFTQHPEKRLLNASVHQKPKPLAVTTHIDWSRWYRNGNLTNGGKGPVVSVYLVCHNYGQYVEQAIESVLAQTYKNYELIIIDDGSTDNSRDIISKYQDRKNVSVIFQEQKGLNITNNIALKASRGRYVMRLDADDYLDPNTLLLMSNFLETNENIGLVFPDYYQVDVQGHILGQTRRNDFNRGEVTLHDQPAHGACTMIRKSCLENLGGYSEEFTCQDGYELWLRFIEKYKVGNINLPLFYYRQHGQNSTNNDRRILETRSRIISQQAAKKSVELTAVGIIPVRGRVTTPYSIASENIGGKSVLDWGIESALESGVLQKIIVSSPDPALLKHVQDKYGTRVVASQRPEKLARSNTHLEETIQHCLEKAYTGESWPGIIFQLNIEFPFRSGMYIEKALNLFKIFDVDSVIAVKTEDSYFYRHNGHGLVPVQADRKLRLEMESLLRETGGLHAVRSTYFKKHHSMVGGRIGHIVLDRKAAHSVVGPMELEVARFLAEQAN